MVLLILLFAAALAAAQDAPPLPRYEATRATGAIVVDGRTEDAAWQNAAPIVLQFPWANQTGARQKTTARLLWDDQNLYVAYDCEDADITAQFLNRDDPTYRDDAVEIFINPDPSQTSLYYGLEMNARAVLYDYFCAFARHFLKRHQFEGVQLATHLRGTLNAGGDKDQGWSLEVAIPWRNFDDLARPLPPGPGTTWTMNINRWDGVEPNRRLSMWSDPLQPKPWPHVPQRFGQLVFK